MVSMYVFEHHILLISLSFKSEKGRGQYTVTRGVKDTGRKEKSGLCRYTGMKVVKKERIKDRKISRKKGVSWSELKLLSKVKNN